MSAPILHVDAQVARVPVPLAVIIVRSQTSAGGFFTRGQGRAANPAADAEILRLDVALAEVDAGGARAVLVEVGGLEPLAGLGGVDGDRVVLAGGSSPRCECEIPGAPGGTRTPDPQVRSLVL